MSISNIIFDCDGVLVDSEPLSMRADVILLARHGIAISEREAYHRFVGQTFQDMMNQLSTETGIDLPPDLNDQKNAMVNEMYRKELTAVHGVHEALTGLRAMGLTMSIGSNSPTQRVELALGLTGLADFFGGRIVTKEDVLQGKPAPDIYLRSAAKAGTRPEDCIVVEDSLTGATAAVAAKCWTLGFTGTNHDDPNHGAKLKSIGAERVFASMSELPGLVLRLMKE